MNFQTEYQNKLKSADEALAVVKNGDWVDFGYCAMTVDALDQAMAKRITSLSGVNFRGGVLLKKPRIFDIESPQNHFIWHTLHASGIERQAIEQGLSYYIPLRYSELPRYYRETYQVDVAMVMVSPMDSHGYFNFGTSVSHLRAACEKASIVIAEVNKNVPVCHGGAQNGIHISDIDMIVEGPNNSIPEMKSPDITDIDNAVAQMVVEQIPNGACLQIGIGGMPCAIGALIAQSDLKDLGVHTEMYVDSFVDIAEAGKISGSRKSRDRYRQTFAFAAGTKKLYEYLHNNPECMSASVDYVNDIRVIASLDNFISINNAVNVDLFGQVSSETSGLRHISGAGGQLDFVLGAYLSNGGKSFICLSSAYKKKDGTLASRLVPAFSNGTITTDTRANIHYLVTEYGIVNLKGLPTWQKAEAIISLSHPDFKDELVNQAESMGIWRKSNKKV